jgi:3-phenylpropionate/trans-cinnamate dioxygenase ferredoxin reductase subunit
MARACVIVGASLAGATAAITLREAGASGPITLIGAEAEMPYERPPLSKTYLRGVTPFETALVRVPAFYPEHGIRTVLATAVTGIDTTRRVVEVSDGRRFAFDVLLIATGTRNRRLPVAGASLDGIHSLRTVADAARIRAGVSTARRAVVVGMGFIGSEVAASLRQSGLDVTTIEASRTPLYGVLGEAVGRRIAELHQGHGVHTVFEDTVEAFEGNSRVETVRTRAGRRFDTDLVVAGIGVEPAIEFLDGSAIHTENGIVVDEYCRTNVEGIYAAGDVANHYHPVFQRRIRVEHWQNAMRQGAAAARNMLGQSVIYDEIPWFWSDQYDWNLQYAGFHRTWEQLAIRGQPERGSFLVCYINEGRIDAAVAVNRGGDLRRVIPLIKARTPVDPRRLADEYVDLRQIGH